MGLGKSPSVEISDENPLNPGVARAGHDPFVGAMRDDVKLSSIYTTLLCGVFPSVVAIR